LSLGVFLVLWTTEPGVLVEGLARLRLPYTLGLGFVMALQYVGTFQQRYHRILEAQQSRGLTLPRANPIRAARVYVPVIVPLIISALRSADSLTLALLSRGFGARGARTSRHALRMQARDWLFVIGSGAALIALSLV
jgi:energy-coupling factor transporter transmembrane protein EcfT